MLCDMLKCPSLFLELGELLNAHQPVSNVSSECQIHPTSSLKLKVFRLIVSKVLEDFWNFFMVFLGLSPFPVTVTTRIITFLVGDPELNLHFHYYWEGGQPKVFLLISFQQPLPCAFSICNHEPYWSIPGSQGHSNVTAGSRGGGTLVGLPNLNQRHCRDSLVNWVRRNEGKRCKHNIDV